MIIVGQKCFHDGAYQFSMALGALVVGDLLGASGMLALDPKRDHRFISSAFAICYSVIFILASINPFAFGLPVLLIFAGVTMTIINTSANGLLQTQVPELIRSQSVSIFRWFWWGSGLAHILHTNHSKRCFFEFREKSRQISNVYAILKK